MMWPLYSHFAASRLVSTAVCPKTRTSTLSRVIDSTLRSPELTSAMNLTIGGCHGSAPFCSLGSSFVRDGLIEPTFDYSLSALDKFADHFGGGLSLVYQPGALPCQQPHRFYVA